MAEILPKQALPKQDFLAVVFISYKRINKDSFYCFFPLSTSPKKSRQEPSSALAFQIVTAHLLIITFLIPKSIIL